GTINDLTAFAAHKMQMPYSVVATAPSMDGYASSVSSITVNGVKQTYNTTAPELIIADLEVLSAAPWEMLQSGLGDLLGKVSSLLEWKLGVVLFDEYFCPEAFDLIKDVLDSLIENTEAIKERKESGIKILIDGLINSGIAMMMVGSSRPASGTEHHISHFFDMYAGIYQEEVPPHGIKVGTALAISSYFYLKLLKTDFSNFEFNHDRKERERNIKRVYLDKAPSILELLDKRWQAELISKEYLLAKEDEIKKNIKSFEKYLSCAVPMLEDFSFFEREDVSNLNRDWLNKAINYSFEIRFRYTISTLLHQLGLLEEWGSEAVVELEKKLN
ncbi:MAG: iron-containing alcohol dehydrogenase, partial [Halanaerobium sp.]